MKYKNNRCGVYLNIFLMVLLLALAMPCKISAQEVFPQQTPSQESYQNIRDTKSPLRAGTGGTGTGDGTNGGGGTEKPGNQNDTEVPLTDALPLLLILAIGYALPLNPLKGTWRAKGTRELQIKDK